MARSGWVSPEGPERLADHVSIGVLTRVFPADVVDAVIARTGALEQRNRLLPSRLMVYYVMSLALFSNGSYEEVMRSLLAGMEWLSGRFREWVMPFEGGDLQGPYPAGVHGDRNLSNQMRRSVGC